MTSASPRVTPGEGTGCGKDADGPVAASVSRRTRRWLVIAFRLGLATVLLIGLAAGLWYRHEKMAMRRARRAAVAGRIPFTPLNMPASTNPPPVKGWAVYEWKEGLYKTRTDTGETRKIAAVGRYPRWSPDGRFVAYWRGQSLVQAHSNGSRATVLVAEVGEPHGLAYHPDGRELYFVDGSTVKSVSLKDRTVRMRLEGYDFRELDLGPGQRLVASIRGTPMHYLLAFDLESGAKRRFGLQGCSASLSPDGRFSIRNSWNHRGFYIDDWTTGDEVKFVPMPRSRLGDDQFWSNHPDWVVSVFEGAGNDIYVQRVADAKFWRVTFCHGCGRPDLFVIP